MQRLQVLPLPLKILAYVMAAAVVLCVAAGVGVVAALVLKPNDVPEGGAKAGQVGKQGKAEGKAAGTSDSDQPSKTAYTSKVADIQNGSVEASLEINGKLLRYDALTADDIAQMKGNYAALADYASQAKGLDPPDEYGRQHEVFVLAIDELRDANELAYRLAAEPASATHADFEAYDGHLSRATAYLKRSNDLLGRNYKTTAAAQKVSFG
jgi:hypothetical protein